ncbi:MAG: WYL domain-containing protein [Acidimicrobiales bacterium]|nr:WYL domain-containing protein [Acidimicrobiales bacterium]
MSTKPPAPPSPSAERLQRLLAMVPWIAAQDGPTLAEVSQRFDITPAQLAADLEVIWLVGLPPYTPDALVDVVQEGDRVWIHYAEVFESAHRLTPDQAVALLTAGASVLALPGADSEGFLARGVEKLAGVLGVDAEQILDIDLGAAPPEILDVLRRGASEHRQVRLDYYSHGRDSRTDRDIDPHLVQAQEGSLYVVGHCHVAGGRRRFRVDRIASATLLDTTFPPPDDDATAEVFAADDGDPRVVLELSPTAHWVSEVHPVEAVEERPDGSTVVTLAVAAAPWLDRLLISLGPEARIRSAPGELADSARRAAARILARYR